MYKRNQAHELVLKENYDFLLEEYFGDFEI